MYRTILLAYDGSEDGAPALRQAGDLAQACKARLHLLGVVATAGFMAMAEATGVVDVWAVERGFAERSLASAAAALTARGIDAVSAVREGDPVLEIGRYAHEIGADLLVLGHKERGVIASLFQRSVGVELIRGIPCSLLIATG